MSERFKHSVKTALAIVLAYGLALWFDWDRPMWAAFAVALISMPTLEASLGKGGQRLWGTALATFVALSLIALFAQDRWQFMFAQAAWLAFCAYQMINSRKAYLWFCAGFVSSIITANGGPDPVNAFSIATIRTLETALGVICFAVVFSLLWPVREDATAGAQPADVQAVPNARRFNQAVRVFIAYCTAFLLVIYVPGFPGAHSILGMLAPFAIILANTPQLSADKLINPFVLAILISSPIYLFLMPKLGGFAQLGVVIFFACFTISYLLHKPEQALGRTFGLAFFAVVTGISNDQSYSFIALTTTILMFCLTLLILHAISAIQVFRVEDDAMVGKTAEST
jgi:uncharacterized membrane protein YccC